MQSESRGHPFPQSSAGCSGARSTQGASCSNPPGQGLEHASDHDRPCDHVDAKERETASEIVTDDVEIFVDVPSQAGPSHRPQVQNLFGYLRVTDTSSAWKVGSHSLAAETAASAKFVWGFSARPVPGRRHHERVAHELAKRGKLR